LARRKGVLSPHQQPASHGAGQAAESQSGDPDQRWPARMIAKTPYHGCLQSCPIVFLQGSCQKIEPNKALICLVCAASSAVSL
jgi:hypothetical protein